jgi:hypothetical protein
MIYIVVVPTWDVRGFKMIMRMDMGMKNLITFLNSRLMPCKAIKTEIQIKKDAR